MSRSKPEKNTLRKLLRRLKRYRLLLVLSLLLAVLSVALTLYVPILVGRAIDLIVGPGQVDFAGIVQLLLRVLLLAAGSALLQWVMSAVNNRISFQLVRDLRNEAFAKIEVLPLKYLDAHAHGELVSRVITDADQLADGLLLGFAQLFTGLVTILGTLLIMLAINWKIALVVVMLTPLSLLLARIIARRSFRLFCLHSEIRAEQTALIDELIGNQKLVQTFSHGDAALEQFDEISARLETAYTNATFTAAISQPATRFVNGLVYAGVGLTGALSCLASGGLFTVGQLASLLSYANQYTKPFNEISGVVTELQNAMASAERVFALIEEPPQPPEAADAVVLRDIAGNVSIQDMSFSYLPERPLIRDLNLTVKPGQRIALVGPTGCGKTTVINLLMRFYDVDGGGIRVEGQDIRSVTRASLRGGFGMVLQDTWLKTGSVRENIAFGRPDATDEEIVATAKSAHAHSFIRRLPQGYDTPVSEEDENLSLGQKQLLCIARVMLCRPPMLILDEATSSIDTRTELKIQAAFARLMEGRTSFIVAHRLSTIREADLILVMRDGSIVERGRHEELLANGGLYAELYNSQFAG
jgi:ATP-binding cassette subfamily B protein